MTRSNITRKWVLAGGIGLLGLVNWLLAPASPSAIAKDAVLGCCTVCSEESGSSSYPSTSEACADAGGDYSAIPCM